jgi:hypothetical protein
MSEMAVEKFDQAHDFDQYLGQLDMERHPLWEKAWIGQDKEAFEQILHDLGADLTYGYEFRVCLYRSRMTNKVEYGVRVGFRERSDKWWTTNMMATSDIVRNTHNSLRATGMRLAINEDSALHEVMMEQAERYAVVVDIKVDMNEVNE